MSGMYWTGPDGITRIIQPPQGGAPNFLGNSPAQFNLPADPRMAPTNVGPMRTGVPATTYNPRLLPVVQQPPGLPATAPQFNPGTGFTMGQGGPAMSAGRPAPLQLGFSGAGAPPPGGGPSVPSGGGIPQRPSMLGRALSMAKGSAPLWAFSGTQMLADAAGAEAQPDQYGAAAIDGGVIDPLAIPKLISGMAYDAGMGLKKDAQSEEVSPFGGMVREGVGNVLTSPVRLGAGLHNKTDDLSQYLSDNLLKSKGEIAKERKAEEDAYNIRMSQEGQRNKEDLLLTTMNTQMGQALVSGMSGSEGATYDLGPAQTNFGGYQLPAPPPGIDYSPVQEAIEKTKPLDPAADIEERRKGAILTGLVGGLLSASMDSDANFGQILGSAGLGVLKGIGAADEYKREATEKFKAAMDQYWIRTAGVRQNQAESDHQYSLRVWQTKAQQLGINAEAAMRRSQAGQAHLRQSGDKFFLEEVVDGRKQLRQMDMGLVNRVAGFTDTLKNMGVPDEKAKFLAADMVQRKDPVYGLQILALGRLKANGNYLNLIETLRNDPQVGKEFAKRYDEAGRVTEGIVTDESMGKKLADNQRDMMLMQAMSASPLLFRQVLQMAEVF